MGAGVGGKSGWLREDDEMKQQIGDRMTDRRWYAGIKTRCRMYSVPTGLYNDAQTTAGAGGSGAFSVSRVHGQQDPEAPEVRRRDL